MYSVYTLGYAGLTKETILKVAKRHNAVVVDVRYKPFTGYDSEYMRQFNNDVLTDFLGHNYVWVGKFLGNMNHNSDNKLDFKFPKEGIGLKWLSQLLQRHNILLLCACKDPLKCHRYYIAKKLMRMNKCKGYNINIIRKKKIMGC